MRVQANSADTEAKAGRQGLNSMPTHARVLRTFSEHVFGAGVALSTTTKRHSRRLAARAAPTVWRAGGSGVSLTTAAASGRRAPAARHSSCPFPATTTTTAIGTSVKCKREEVGPLAMRAVEEATAAAAVAAPVELGQRDTFMLSDTVRPGAHCPPRHPTHSEL